MRTKLVLTVSLLVTVAGGGIAFYVHGQSQSIGSPSAATPPVFVPIDTFTVNLVSAPTQMQVLQAGITLKLREKATAVQIKDSLPEIRHRVVMTLSAQRSQELLSATGKQKLAAELGNAIAKVISSTESAVATEAAPTQSAVAGADLRTVSASVEVLFTSFIIQ